MDVSFGNVCPIVLCVYVVLVEGDEVEGPSKEQPCCGLDPHPPDPDVYIIGKRTMILSFMTYMVFLFSLLFRFVIIPNKLHWRKIRWQAKTISKEKLRIASEAYNSGGPGGSLQVSQKFLS